MMDELNVSIKIVSFFLKNSIFIQTKNRKFIEYILEKMNKCSNFFLLNLLLILKRKNSFDIAFFSTLWLKNFLTKYFSYIEPTKQIKLFNILLVFILNSPFKFSRQFYENFIEIFKRNRFFENKQIFNIFKNIAKKFELKILKKNKQEFVISHLNILQNFIFSFKYDNLNYSFLLNLLKLWKILSGNKNNYFPTIFENTFDNIFRILLFNKNNVFQYDENKNSITWINCLISLILPNSEIFKNEKNLKLKFEEKIFYFIKIISEDWGDFFILFTPIFLKLGLSKKNFKEKKTLSFVSWLIFLVNSTNIEILKYFSNFFTFLFFIILFCIGFKDNQKKKIFYPYKIISFFYKIDFQEKNLLAILFYVSLKIFLKKKFFFFIYSKISNYNNNLLIKNLIEHFIHWSGFFLKIKGNNIIGLTVTFSFLKIDMIFFYFKNFFLENKTLEYLNFVDFFIFYRYQISIKNILKVLMFLIKDFDEKILKENHKLIALERLLSLRGNDGIGTIMIYLNEEKKTSLECIILKIFTKFFPIVQNIENLSKLLLRITLNFSKTDYILKEKIQILFFFFTNFSESIFTNNLFYQYFLESVLFDLIFQNNKLLLNQIAKFGNNIFNLKIEQFLPFVFDFFSSLVSIENNNSIIFNSTLKNFFEGVLNPYVWGSKILSKCMLKFLSTIINQKFFFINNIEIKVLFVILEINLYDFGESVELFFFIVSLVNLLKKNSFFVPRFLELLYYYFIKFNQNQNFLSFFFDLVFFLIKKTGILCIKQKCEIIRTNFYFLFLNNIFLKNFRLENFYFFSDETDYFEDIYRIDKNLSKNFFFEKFIEKLTRKIINNLNDDDEKKINFAYINFRWSLYTSQKSFQNCINKIERKINYIVNEMLKISINFPEKIFLKFIFQ
jgi:hypothetical protein